MSHSLTGTATAYCIKGQTSCGTPAGPGTIAVNPKVIPYRKNLHVTWDGGFYDGISLDTGGAARKGQIIVDLWFDSEDKCKKFGRRQVTVTWND